MSALTVAALVLSTFGLSFGQATPVAYAAEPVCSTITLTSGGTTQTAGYTVTNPTSAPASLDASAYSGGSFSAAPATETVIPPWADPSTDPAFTSAVWTSSGASWPGGSGNTEGTSSEDQWRLFSDGFTLPADATVTSATLSYAADNAATVYLNDAQITSTNGATDDVYGPTPAGGPQNFAAATNATFTPVAGDNTLKFVVRNWSTDPSTPTNPTGLLYKATINYCVPAVTTPGTDTVTIVKNIDGVKATPASGNNQDFPMMASWSADNIGSSSGQYALSAAGYNGDPTPYQAKTVDMSNGGSYATNEMTDGTVVGASCTDGKPFALVGYTTGATLADAEAASSTMTSPAFTNLQGDQYVVVWNKTCGTGTGTLGGDVTGGVTGDAPLMVTSVTPVKTSATADGTFANGWTYVFHITAPNSEQNLSMKFADWMSTVGSTTIPVANNMRISSAQADNGGTPIVLTAANAYSTPPLHMTGDLDGATAGRQVDVTVEVAIPSGSTNGSYTTSYGVQTLP